MMTPLLTMSLRVCSICSQNAMGTFCWACCPGGMEGSVLNGIGPGMLPMVSKELGMLASMPICVQTWVVVHWKITLGDCTLWVDVRGVDTLEPSDVKGWAKGGCDSG